MDCSKLFDKAILSYFMSVLRANLSHPSILPFLFKAAFDQKKAACRRKQLKTENLYVPPLMIFSLTNRCNLGCAGCYNKMRAEDKGKELNTEEMTGILEQARTLGVSIALFAGGEPLLRDDIFKIAGTFKDIIFPVFTNGLAIDDDMAAKFRANRNVIPVISVEGESETTDLRRGPGTYNRLLEVFKRLDRKGVLFGTSITATSANIEEITSPGFIGAMRKSGCRLFFFIEYVPVSDNAKGLVLSEPGKKQLVGLMPGLDSKHKAVFITFPGNEDVYGGCLASGRGFIHVNPSGDMEPCPFAPFSDVNLRRVSLKDALSSKLLEKIRENHGELKETSGGCALWNKREWVASLLK